MGTLQIEWQEIADLKSSYHYDVRLSNGSRFYGSLEHADKPGEIRISHLHGDDDVDFLKVVEVRPVEDKLIDRIDVYLSAGYSFDKASSVAQTSLNTSINYEDQRSLNQFTGRSTYTDTDEDTTSSGRADLTRYVWTDRSQLFTSSFANYETNDELALDHRIGIGAGLGRFFVDTHKVRLAGTTGLQVITENADGQGEEQNVELYLTANFKTWRFTTPELDIDTTWSLYPSITDSGRLRSAANLRVRWEIIEDLYFDLSTWGSFDNQSGSEDDLDYGVTTGLGWSY